MDKFFKDETSLLILIKLALIFGPGFLAFGYFNLDLFTELDWLKVLSISAIFAVIFTLPIFFLLWVIQNYSLWSLRYRLGRTVRSAKQGNVKQSKLRAKLNDLIEKAEAAGDTIRLEQLKEIDLELREQEVKSQEIEKEQKSIDKNLSKKERKANFYKFVYRRWNAFLILFFEVSLFIGVDYFSGAGKGFHDLVSFLTINNFVAFPVIGLAVELQDIETRYSGLRKYLIKILWVVCFIGGAAICAYMLKHFPATGF